jgi:hypothetical protein
LIAIAVGATFGYCEIGSPTIASAPANMIRIATTQAKIGRSIKK